MYIYLVTKTLRKLTEASSVKKNNFYCVQMTLRFNAKFLDVTFEF